MVLFGLLAFPMPAMAQNAPQQANEFPVKFLGAYEFPGKTSFEVNPELITVDSRIEIVVEYYDNSGEKMVTVHRIIQVGKDQGGIVVVSTTPQGAITLNAYVVVSDLSGTASLGLGWLDQPVQPTEHVFLPFVPNQEMIGQ
jgi:hypothetical protein